jgi:rubrerythrin
MSSIMSPADCKEVMSDLAIRWLVEHNAKFYCAYCGYTFKKMPKLPTSCPKCRKRLTKICMPIFEPRPRVRL